MKRFGLFLFVLSLLVCTRHTAGDIVHMVLEQDAQGNATHHAADLSPIGEGLDPVLQFILFNTPSDDSTAQVLWQASETPILWQRSAAQEKYPFVSYAVLPEGSRLEYRVFDYQDETELMALRHSRAAGDRDFGLDESIIDALPNGQYHIHAHLIVPEQPRQVIKQRVDLVDIAQEPVAGNDPEPVQDGPSELKPGTGFTGETPQPAAVGDQTTMTIARWDVVPYQRFDGEFEVGVMAFHAYGMDRVEMSFNGGAWQTIEKPTFNPRTGVEEYWAKIDAADVKDGRVELRAIAYPKHGTPRVLDTLVLFANSDGTVRFPVVELDAGAHVIPDRLKLPEEGWYTFRAKPGVPKEKCIVYRIGRNHTPGNLKIEGLTVRAGPSNRGNGNGGRLWMDNVDYIGKDADTTDGELTWWMADHKWKAKYHTNMNIRQLQTAFHTCNDGIIRNVTLESIYEDVFRQAGLIANVMIEDLTAAKKTYHPDVFQWYNRNPTNMIVYNVTAKRVAGQGLFPGNLTDCAFVKLDLNIVGQYRPLQMQGKTSNVLIQDSKLAGELDGLLRYDKGFEPKDLVFRDNQIGPDLAPNPRGWQNREIKVFPQPED